MLNIFLFITLIVLSSVLIAIGFAEVEKSKCHLSEKTHWYFVLPTYALFLMSATIHVVLLLTGRSVNFLFMLIITTGAFFIISSIVFIIQTKFIKNQDPFFKFVQKVK